MVLLTKQYMNGPEIDSQMTNTYLTLRGGGALKQGTVVLTHKTLTIQEFAMELEREGVH